jgi:hypothetical protein
VHRVFAPRKKPPALVQQLRDAFARLEDDKEFLAELKKVGGDADGNSRRAGVRQKHHQETPAALARRLYIAWSDRVSDARL